MLAWSLNTRLLDSRAQQVCNSGPAFSAPLPASGWPAVLRSLARPGSPSAVSPSLNWGQERKGLQLES